jgi:hypothetical protein
MSGAHSAARIGRRLDMHRNIGKKCCQSMTDRTCGMDLRRFRQKALYLACLDVNFRREPGIFLDELEPELRLFSH